MAHKAENIVPLRDFRNRPLTILAVDDDRMERMFLERQIGDSGHKLLQAEQGVEALEILKKNKGGIDVVIMDRLMPMMDGITAVRRMKEDAELRKIPVIMVTGAGGEKEMQEGLEAGVFYYLQKPVNEDMLQSVLLAATREAEQKRSLSEELRRHRASFDLIHTVKFQFRTIDEAEDLAAFVAHCFPDPERVLTGLAELMINAIEHGNLEIGYEGKSQLLEQGTWKEEIARRLEDEKYWHRKAEAVLTRKEDGIYFIVTDEGNGFNWRKYMMIDPSRAGDNHGRGIAQANAVSFDKLAYNAKGNQVVAFVSGHQQLEW
jgi:CheY-like chemotaxis protein/anti-sigma regulatory factor (Ser/Thr protein kinase)